MERLLKDFLQILRHPATRPDDAHHKAVLDAGNRP